MLVSYSYQTFFRHNILDLKCTDNARGRHIRGSAYKRVCTVFPFLYRVSIHKKLLDHCINVRQEVIISAKNK